MLRRPEGRHGPAKDDKEELAFPIGLGLGIGESISISHWLNCLNAMLCRKSSSTQTHQKSRGFYLLYYYVVYTNDINGEITVLRGTNFVTNLGLVTELTHEKWPAGGIEGMQSNAKIFW